MGTAVQSGNKIIITNNFGSVSRTIDGRLISYVNGTLKYASLSGGTVSTYVGI